MKLKPCTCGEWDLHYLGAKPLDNFLVKVILYCKECNKIITHVMTEEAFTDRIMNGVKVWLM